MSLSPGPASRATSEGSSSEDLSAPLYVAWQLTNECNFSCLHCIEGSGPGKAMSDELGRAESFEVLSKIVDAQVPYVCLSGGEPMLHPYFFELAEAFCARGVGLKVETNGSLLTQEACRRFRAMGVKAVQVSLDGVTEESFSRLRRRGRLEHAVEGLRRLREAGVCGEAIYSPTRFNAEEIGRAVDLAFGLGARSFYTGRTMRAGNAERSWDRLTPSEEQYAAFFGVVREKAAEYEGRMRIYYHEMGIIEELKYRLDHPAALFILLPNGKVKLINTLPFVCGDLRRQSLDEVWAAYRRAWKDPRVRSFVGDLEKDPGRIAELHRWIEL